MSPVSTQYNLTHSGGGDSIGSRYGRLNLPLCRSFSYVSDLLFRNFARAYSLASYVSSSFSFPIAVVVQSGPKEQMFRIYTLRNVTFMTYKHVAWNISKMDLPALSMSKRLSVVMMNAKAIAFGVSRSRPQPAGVCFVNFSPKSTKIVHIVKHDTRGA